MKIKKLILSIVQLDEFNIYIYKIVFKKIYSNLDPKLQDIINNERK